MNKNKSLVLMIGIIALSCGQLFGLTRRQFQELDGLKKQLDQRFVDRWIGPTADAWLKENQNIIARMRRIDPKAAATYQQEQGRFQRTVREVRRQMLRAVEAEGRVENLQRELRQFQEIVEPAEKAAPEEFRLQVADLQQQLTESQAQLQQQQIDLDAAQEQARKEPDLERLTQLTQRVRELETARGDVQRERDQWENLLKGINVSIDRKLVTLSEKIFGKISNLRTFQTSKDINKTKGEVETILPKIEEYIEFLLAGERTVSEIQTKIQRPLDQLSLRIDEFITDAQKSIETSREKGKKTIENFDKTTQIILSTH